MRETRGLRRGHKYPRCVRTMSSEAGEPSSDDNLLEKAGPNRAALDRLTKDYQDLSDKAQQLLTEKLFLENEMNQLKKR